MKNVLVCFCCNDGGNGAFTGHLSALDVFGQDGDLALQLEGPFGEDEKGEETEGVPFAEEPGYAIVAGKRYPLAGKGKWKAWVGSWCWDAARMDLDVLAVLLADLQASGLWSINEGEMEVFERWQAGQAITAAHLERALA